MILGVIKPTLRFLSPLHNFTIESQVQYYAPLAFELTRYGGIGSSPYFALGEDQLKIFVNSIRTLTVIRSLILQVRPRFIFSTGRR